jgi:signal transduction histidine kinase
VKQVIFFGSPALHIDGLPEAWIKASKYELMRVFQNLYKNSIESGATRIVTEIAAKGANVLVSVTDNGPGMDEERVHLVMHGGFTTKENGTGLGLSICRHLTGAHGGEFSIESEPGVGTTIRLVLPAAPRK